MFWNAKVRHRHFTLMRCLLHVHYNGMACIGISHLFSHPEPVSVVSLIPQLVSQCMYAEINISQLKSSIVSHRISYISRASVRSPLNHTSGSPVPSPAAARRCPSNLPGRPPFLRSAARTQQTIGMATKNKAAALLLCFLFLAAIVSAEVCMLHW